MGLEQRVARRETKKGAKIPGSKSLHRGIHVHENASAVASFKTNAFAKRSDHRSLMVHHQKVNEELKDVYARTAALESENLTMAQRKEQTMRQFERIGGKRPREQLGYRAHLDKVQEERKNERERGEVERRFGETADYNNGSALHNMKDRRVKTFVDRQLKRAHMLRRYGDPTPLKQSGTFDRFTGTFSMFNKTKRQTVRAIQHDSKIQNFKETQYGRHGGGRSSMWDVKQHDINRPDSHVVQDSSADWNLGPANKRRRR